MTDRELMQQALEALEHIIYWDNEKPEWEYAHAAITALRSRLAQPEQEPVSKYCCHACFDKSGQVFLERMILCPECGNKRCPKATNHELQCTNSNEPNQAGSAFTTYGYSPEAAVAVYTHQPQRDELREKLTQPEQKPMHPTLQKMWEGYFDKCYKREWVGLTDVEIHRTTVLMGFNPEWTTEIGVAHAIVRNLEAKLKERNT